MASHVSLSAYRNISGVVTRTTPFAPTIPVVDISQFENTAMRGVFLASLEKGLKVGFFGVVNPALDLQTIQEGYAAFQQFFASSHAEKMKIHDPKVNGQRGFVPGETAVGSSVKDMKEFVHIGCKDNIWPKHMDLEGPAMRLYRKMMELRIPLLRATSLLLGKEENFLTDATAYGENLMRALHYYPKPKGTELGVAHTDTGLMTILPYASEVGLELKQKNEWIPVVVPRNSLVINVADMLEVLSNGAWPSCEHRVISTVPNKVRESIVFFIHPTDDMVIKPLGKTAPRYPEGTRLEHLNLRLFTIKLLSKEREQQVINGEFVKRIKHMIDTNTASESVHRWYLGYQKILNELNPRARL